MKALLHAASAALVAVTLVACQGGSDAAGAAHAAASSGALRISARLEGAAASAVSKVTVSILSSDPGDVVPSIELSSANGVYTGTFPKLRASTNGGPTYALTARATDAAGTLLYVGSAGDVFVTEGVMSTVHIVANGTAPIVHTDYVPVRITALQAAGAGEQLTFRVAFNADATAPVTVAWTQVGATPATAGTFSAAGDVTTTWSAPATTTYEVVTLRVSLTNGAGAPSTLTFDVEITPRIDVPVEVSLNDAPVIESMGLSAPRIPPDGTVDLTVNATDANGDPVLYAFTAGTCAGAFGAPIANTATFAAGGTAGTCKLHVLVTDGRGGEAQGDVTLVVDPGPPEPSFAVTVSNQGPGTVTSSPAGISCAASTVCSATFASGTTVVLTAATDTGYFNGWFGSCAGTGTCTLSGGSDKYVVAYFSATAPAAHPDYSDPAVHAPAYHAVPQTLVCTDCHGAELQGLGLAPSCSACHGWPFGG